MSRYIILYYILLCACIHIIHEMSVDKGRRGRQPFFQWNTVTNVKQKEFTVFKIQYIEYIEKDHVLILCIIYRGFRMSMLDKRWKMKRSFLFCIRLFYSWNIALDFLYNLERFIIKAMFWMKLKEIKREKWLILF